MSLTYLKRAFLPETDPIKHLPEPYKLWDDILMELPDLLAAGKARQVLSRIPVIDVKNLSTNPEKERALGILSVFGHAAVHESWRKGSSSSVPKHIALPWVALAKSMGRHPVLAYASHGLNNWSRIDKDGPISLGNLTVLRGFYGGLDENWFVMAHVEIEACAIPLVNAIVAARTAILENNPAILRNSLVDIADALTIMTKSLVRVRENCDPFIFFNRVQPFMQGMRGVIYEGVEEFANVPQNHPGGSGAQSTLLPLLDAALGIQHAVDSLLTYLQELRGYMPQEHQAFLSEVEHGPSIRKYVTHLQEQELVDEYNKCIECLGQFRAKHLEMSIDYIQRPAKQQASNRGEVGTGGSPFVVYLKKHREETFAHSLKSVHSKTGTSEKVLT